MTDTFVLGTLFDIIAVKHTPSIPNLMPGDKFICQLRDIHLHDEMCQLQTVPMEKGTKRENRDQEDGDEQPPVKKRRRLVN